jgi:hypothetical protein
MGAPDSPPIARWRLWPVLLNGFLQLLAGLTLIASI